MRIQNKKILASILFVLMISFVCLAEEKLPPQPSTAKVAVSNAPPPVNLPIDSGVIGALFLGFLYGIKKILSKKP